MSPQQQLQKLLADILTYDADDIAAILPIAAALVSVLCVRSLALNNEETFPETDYLLNIDEIARRIGKSTKWVRENIESLPFAFLVGKEHRFSARGLDEWIRERRVI